MPSASTFLPSLNQQQEQQAGECDLSFLATEYDEDLAPRVTSLDKDGQEEEQDEGGKKGGKEKKRRNRKHHSCEPCRQRKVKCDRQSNCANCRLHHKRCYYVNAQPVSASAEDELVAAREEIERLRSLVRMLMRGGKVDEAVGFSSSSSATTSTSAGSASLSDTFPNPYALPSPPATAHHFAPSPQPQPGYLFPSPPAAPSIASSDSSSSAYLAPPLTFDLAVRRHSDPSPSTSTTMEASGFRLPASLSANFVASRGSSSATAPSFSSASTAEQAYPTYLDPTLFLPA